MRPYTDDLPKPMLPILGKPLLERTVQQFQKYGVTEFFIALHHLPEKIQEYFGNGTKWGIKIVYSVDPLEYETAGRVKQFERCLDDEFFVIYGDILSLVDYGQMEAAWRQKPAGAIGMQRMARAEQYADADVAELDADGKFVAIHPKPHKEHYANAWRMRGIFIWNKKMLSYISGPKEQIGKDLLPKVVSAGEKFYGYECADYSKGIDTEEKWKEVEQYLSTHENL